MGSATRIYIQSFIKISSAIEKLIREFASTQHDHLIRLLLLIKITKVG